MVELGRLLTAMVTPMDERGEVDWAKTRDLANRSAGLRQRRPGCRRHYWRRPHPQPRREAPTLGRGQGGSRRPGRGDCQHRQLLHLGQHQPQPGGGRGGRRRAVADGPLLQQAPPGGHLPALQGNRRIDPSALHPLQHPRPHRHQDVSWRRPSGPATSTTS